MELIKVFITEDESIVREGLRDMIPWEKYGFEFVGDAPDGEMALPMIRRLKPDLLITDIKMPFMDGLSLSGIISREFPNMKIIIISGYSDFEYARKAIELNVDQYLLKPVTKTAMIKALEQTRSKLEEENEQKEYLNKYEQEAKKYESFTRRAFFEKMVEGSMSVEEIYAQARELNLNLNADSYNFVIFTVQSVNETMYEESSADVLDSLLDSLLRFPGYILFRCNLHSHAVLILGDRDSIESLTQRCVDIIRSGCTATEKTLSWYVAVGAPTDRLSGLPKCYADANHILSYRYLMPSTRVFTSDMLKEEREPEDGAGFEGIDPAAADPMVIRNFIQTGISEDTENFTDEYLESFGGTQNSAIFMHYLIVSTRINAAIILQELGCDKEEFLRRVTVEKGLAPHELRDYLINVLSTAITMRDSKSQQQHGDLVDSAIRYIDKNYTDENISLNSVAQAINISTNYLSALFSQRLGVSFVDYLTQKRMTKAKQLLRQSSKRSSEIAYEVGYKDPRYFSFVFKKTQGCTPKSFRTGEADNE